MGSLAIPLLGKVIDDHGPRLVVAISASGFALALLLIGAQSSSVWTTAGILGLRVFGTAGLWLASSVTIALWFTKRRGFVLGIVVGVGSAGISLIPVAMSELLRGWSVNQIFIGYGLLTILIIIPIAVWGMVDQPSQIGQFSDGLVPTHSHFQVLPGVTARTALSTGFLMVVAASASLVALLTTAFLFHEVEIFLSQGLTAQAAALNLIPQMAGNLIAILIFSSLVDRFRMRWIVILAMLQVLSAIWWGFHLSGSSWSFAFGFYFGCSSGVIFGFVLGALPRYFGTRHLGQIRGTVGALTVTASACGPLLMEVLHGFDPSYRLFMLIPLVPAAILSVASMRVRWPEPISFDD